MKRKITKLLVCAICLLAGLILVSVSDTPAKVPSYISTKLKSEKDLIFEPTDGEKDQQGLHTDSFYMNKFPVGVLKAEQSFQSYTVRIYEDLASPFEGSFEILRNGHRIYARTGNKFEIGNIRGDKKQSDLIPIGKDITGDGKPDLVVSEWSGGAHRSYYYYIFEISEEFRLLDEISIDNDTFVSEFADLDKDSKLEFIMSDGTFAYWVYSFAESPMPRVVFSFRDGAYRLATDLMRKPASTFLELTTHAREILDSDDWDTQTAWPPSKLWGYMLDLIYTGHAGLVH